jgi:hypothetical protein
MILETWDILLPILFVLDVMQLLRIIRTHFVIVIALYLSGDFSILSGRMMIYLIFLSVMLFWQPKSCPTTTKYGTRHLLLFFIIFSLLRFAYIDRKNKLSTLDNLFGYPNNITLFFNETNHVIKSHRQTLLISISQGINRFFYLYCMCRALHVQKKKSKIKYLVIIIFLK